MSLSRLYAFLRLPRTLQVVAWVVLFGSLTGIYGECLVQHVTYSASPYRFNDDVRIGIYPFFRYETDALKEDYLGDYALALHPIGYYLLFLTYVQVGDAETLSKVLPYLLYIVMLGAFGVVGYRLGDKAGVWATLAVCLGSSLYLSRMVGGLPRGFAYPLLACTLAALAVGKVRWLVLFVWIGAAFYPPIGVAIGAVLTVVLLFLPDADRGDARGWSLKRRLVTLGVTVVVSVLLLLPTVIQTADYGRRLSVKDKNAYPEILKAHGSHDRAPYPDFFEYAPTYTKLGMQGAGDPWWKGIRKHINTGSIRDLVMILSLVGWIGLMLYSASARRVFAFFVGIVIAYAAARGFDPYLYAASRYVLYSVPPLITVVVPFGVLGIAQLAKKKQLSARAKNIAVAAYMLPTLLLIGGRGHDHSGLVFAYNKSSAAIYEAIAALPEDVMVAGWPDDPMSTLPYLSRRRAFMTGEMQLALHEGYVKRTRQRLRLLFNAYLATEIGPVLELRDKGGVTHVMMQRNHFRPEPPKYMNPGGGWIETLRRKAKGKKYILPKLAKSKAAVFSDSTHVLIDLRNLSKEWSQVPKTRWPYRVNDKVDPKPKDLQPKLRQ